MQIAIHQPNFLPRLKVLQKLAAAETWVVLDNVQYCAREWQNRARIIPEHGDRRAFWLSVPVHLSNGRDTLIRSVEVLDTSSTATHIARVLRHALRSTPHWEAVQQFVTAVDPSLRERSLVDLCIATTVKLLTMAGASPQIVRASSLSATGKGSQLIAGICRELGADTYLADSGSIEYLKLRDFDNTQVMWQHWQEPVDRVPGIDSWRDISCLNYLARSGSAAFMRHLHEILLRTYPPRRHTSH
jgi:hypothetical protein